MTGVRVGLLAVATALVGLNPMLMPARMIIPPTVEDMEHRATLVCNAVVESVTRGGPVYFDDGKVTQIRMEAKLRVLHVFKGSAPLEITYFYRPNDNLPNSTSFNLAKNARYRFFLVPGVSQGEFTDTQWGLRDEMFGIEPLGAQEPDDSPPLRRDEAIRLAMAAAHVSPNDIPDWAKVFVMTWPESIDTRHIVYLATRTGGNRVTIMGDRTILSTD